MVELHILAQSLVALVLGGAIGWEREAAGKFAGLRTHMLVCLGGMLFIRVGELLILHATELQLGAALRTDPVRLIEAIVTGIAFIGAGTVFRDPSHHRAEGLTTAAGLLAVAPIGIAVALDRYVLAAGITVLILAVLRLVSRLERSMAQSPHHIEPPQQS